METNQNLESILERVSALKRDLSAEIVIQEEKSHEEEQEYGWIGGSRGGSSPGYEDYNAPSQVKVIDQPRIVEPDTQKIEAAMAQLRQIYDSTDWYSVKYVVGKKIKSDMTKRVNGWVEELNSNLDATTLGEPHVEPYRYPGDGYMGLSQDEFPDTEKREKAEKDLDKLISLLDNSEKQELYHHSDAEIRYRAGKSLGHSDLKIWTDENPVEATVAFVTASAAAIGGLSYAIYQHMAR